MGAYSDFLSRRFSPGGLSDNRYGLFRDAFDSLYNNAHGGYKYALSQLPVYGRDRQFRDTVKRWEDQYRNTGIDPQYSTAYGSGGLPYVNELTSAAKPQKMVNTLARMYTAEVELDLSKIRFLSNVESGKTAVKWKEAWETKNRWI